jgi:hypothetical protein
MPETVSQVLTAPAQNAAPQTPAPTDLHVKAARGYEMAAALHHEAARFYADGDAENALECAKQALTHARRADELAAQLTGAAAPAKTH